MQQILFATVLFTVATICASSRSTLEDFFPRDLEALNPRFTCTVPGYTQCPQAGLPNNFCCPADTVCLSLGASFTILCCPAGSDCSNQSPISCDIEQQNATAHPESLIKTTDLSSDMFTCGSGCCPFGFNCSTNGNCSMFAEQKSIIDAELATLSTATPSSTSAVSSATTSNTVSITSSSTSTPSNTGTASIPTATATDDHHSISVSTGALVGGIVAIVVVIAVLAIVLFWLFSKKRKSKKIPKLEAQTPQETRPESSSRNSFRKAELDNSTSRVEMDSASSRRELDGSTSSRKSSGVRELEGDAAHEVSGDSQIHEMEAGPVKGRFSWA